MKKYKLIKSYPAYEMPLEAHQLYNANFIIKDRPNDYYEYTERYFKNFPEFWEKVKEPLFITEDGHCMFDINNNVYGVLPKATWEIRIFNIMKCLSTSNKEWKFFSSKEIAKTWIDENKPSFSKKQIRDAINKHKHLDNNGYYINLNIEKEFGL